MLPHSHGKCGCVALWPASNSPMVSLSVPTVMPCSPGPPVPATQEWDRAQDLLVVWETNDRAQLGKATELLAQSGIPYSVLGQLATPPRKMDQFPHLRPLWHTVAMASLTRPSLASPSPWAQVRVAPQQCGPRDSGSRPLPAGCRFGDSLTSLAPRPVSRPAPRARRACPAAVTDRGCRVCRWHPGCDTFPRSRARSPRRTCRGSGSRRS